MEMTEADKSKQQAFTHKFIINSNVLKERFNGVLLSLAYVFRKRTKKIDLNENKWQFLQLTNGWNHRSHEVKRTVEVWFKHKNQSKVSEEYQTLLNRLDWKW